MKPLLRAVPLTLLLCALLPIGAFACDCSNPGPPCKAFANTPTIFAGRVTQIKTISLKTPSGNSYDQLLIFREVEQSYRGSVGKTAEVVTGNAATDCGYAFRQGEHYLVYAFPHPASGKLYTSICQRTAPISQASEDLKYLRDKEDPSHGAGIEGTIEGLTKDPRFGRVGVPMTGIKVAVKGSSGHWTTVSEKDGAFRLWGLRPGRYRITPILPAGYFRASETVSLLRNSCATVGFLATPTQRSK